MLLYTSILVVCFLVAVPIMILIYESIFVANKAASDSSCDELMATTGRIPGQKFRVTPLKLNHVKATVRSDPDTVRSFHEENFASVDRSSKAGVKEVPGAVTFESVCKPFKRKVSADTQKSETVKKSITRELAPMTPNPGTGSNPFSRSLAPMTPNPGTASNPFSRSLAPMTPNPGTGSKPFSRSLAPGVLNAENAGRPWGW